MATIRDVAREARVGVGTVSRVLNGHPQVAPTTRTRVEAAIDKLDFQPNPVARGLSTRRTHMIEVLLPLVTRHFYVEVLRGIELGLAETDYGLLIHSIERVADRDHAFAQAAARGYADGVLIVSVTPTAALLARLQAVHCPVVLVDTANDQLSSVQVDHAAAARLAVGHLLAFGHQRIALIDRPEDPFTPLYTGGRRTGYHEALSTAGLPLRPEYAVITDFSPEAGGAALNGLLALPDPPTAVFVGSDTQAIGVLDAARQGGYRVPDDLSVLGYNDIEVAQYLGLSTMRVPMRAMGQQGVQLLLAALAGPGAAPAHICLPAEVVVRLTTGPVPDGAKPLRPPGSESVR